MQVKYWVIPVTLFLASLQTAAQRVKRKGVTPMDVTKNKGANGKDAILFTLEQFNGKWQETGRVDRENNLARIFDTLMLNFTEPGKVITRDGNHANIMGNAEIAPGNVLLAAADVYTIISVTPEQLVLDDQENYIHTFTKTESFTYESYGKTAVKPDVYTTPVSIKSTDILGKWSVYRRQAKPGAIHPPTNIIRYLFIRDKVDDITANGEITFYVDEKSQAMSCTVKINNDAILITAGSNTWNLSVYKADGKEFIFGDPEVLLYYAKVL